MNTKQKHPVNRQRLLDALKAKRQQLVAEYEAARVRAADERGPYRTAAAHALERALDALDEGKLLTTYAGRDHDPNTTHFLALPGWPREPRLHTLGLDRSIALLELSDADNVSISAEDYGAYIDGK